MSIPKIIAFYFPQFHEIPENNEWWGKGFTDWELVKKAKPLYDGHYQPRIPIDENYYNPCEKQTLKSQAELAKKYGIEGFMFYHYWFDGKLYLEKPMEVFLSNTDIDISFCVTWANESWTRSWIGKPEIVLQKQSHSIDKVIWENHFNYLLPFFKDTRAIRIEDKPVFIIYQPFLINDSKSMLDYWNELAIKSGLKGLYFIAVKNHNYQSSEFLDYYDAIMKFQPREAYSSKEFNEYNISARFQFLRRLPLKAQLYLTKLNQRLSKHKVFDSKVLWDIIIKNSFKNTFENNKLKIFESAFFEWDNTPRYKNKAKIFTGLSNDEKKENLKKLMVQAINNDSPYVFFNAWNEWSESAYLEPDKKFGFKNLEIIKEVIDDLNNELNFSKNK